MLTQWFEHLETFEMCEKLQSGMYSGMLDFKACNKLKNDWLREAGFILPVDLEFSTFFASFKERKLSFNYNLTLREPGKGKMVSRAELEYNRLRNQLVRARHRIMKQDKTHA